MSLPQEDIVRTLLAARLRIAAAAWMITRDPQAAEDIFQNVSVKALNGTATFDNGAQLVSWAMVSARHEALNWVRRRKNRTLVLDETVLALLEEDWVRAATAPTGRRVEALRDCLERLPERSRQLLHVRYFEGRSCGETARALHVGLEAVYQRLSRLHRALRDCIERRLAEEDV